MDRKGAYVRPARKLTVPGVVFAVVVHANRTRPRNGIGQSVASWRSAEIAVSHRRKSGWSVPDTVSVSSPHELREWLDDRAITGRTNWVVAPSASEALTLSGWWDYAESRDARFDRASVERLREVHDGGRHSHLRIDRIVMSGNCEILEYVERGTRWRWVGAANYWPDAGAGTEDNRDLRGVSDGLAGADGASGSGDRGSDARAVLARFRGLCDWWGRIATAPLGCTAGQCAWGVLRSYVAPRSLCTHSDDDAHRLERCAAHGGRASVWHSGEVLRPDVTAASGDDPGCAGPTAHARGPIHHVDVSSMYPYLLARESYPVKLASMYADMRPSALVELARTVGVIARVRISTRAGEYPYRRNEGTQYPTGTFVTTLPGPDILELQRDGEIERVYECATYHMGRPFADGINALISARADARESGRTDDESLSKLVANSLGGKLSQRAGGWERWPRMDEAGRWGEYHEIDSDTGGMLRYRWLMGQCSVWRQDKYPRGPHTAAFAYLTSYGRIMMRRIRDLCPPRTVVSQSTDGLYLLAEGYQSLSSAGILSGTGAGALRDMGSADSGQWWGARCYRWGSKWVLSGYGDWSVNSARSEIDYSQRTPITRLSRGKAPRETVTTYHSTALPSDLEGGWIGLDGWIQPPHYRPRKVAEGEA